MCDSMLRSWAMAAQMATVCICFGFFKNEVQSCFMRVIPSTVERGHHLCTFPDHIIWLSPLCIWMQLELAHSILPASSPSTSAFTRPFSTCS